MTNPIPIIPKIDAIILFFVVNFSFGHKFIIIKVPITTAKPINMYLGI